MIYCYTIVKSLQCDFLFYDLCMYRNTCILRCISVHVIMSWILLVLQQWNQNPSLLVSTLNSHKFCGVIQIRELAVFTFCSNMSRFWVYVFPGTNMSGYRSNSQYSRSSPRRSRSDTTTSTTTSASDSSTSMVTTVTTTVVTTIIGKYAETRL